MHGRAGRYANAEAVAYFSQALELTPDEDLAGRYVLLRAREQVFDFQGARQAEAQDLAALDSLTGKNRADINVGASVKVVQKQDQCTGKFTEGIVQAILTKSGTHPHGIKVRLESGVVGRVKEIL